jgi:NTE family protein
MDAGLYSQSWRPEGCDSVALVLQGGGALGAYQAGVYESLHERGLEPDWVAGVSIGAINGALIAGNPPERRLERLRAFWERITDSAVPDGAVLPWLDSDLSRKMLTAWASWLAMLRGQNGLFRPRVPNPWLLSRGSPGATSLYDSRPLAATLAELVDFDLLNDGPVRYACGAVHIASGNFAYFDNAGGGSGARSRIGPEHVLASAALPPALPMVTIGERSYWDGGLVSNTPLQHVLEHAGSDAMLVFQVDLFSARGPMPRDMFEVLNRQKDIQYSSRTRLVTDFYRRMHQQKQCLCTLFGKIPDQQLTDAERALKQELEHLPEFTILHLIYQQAAHEGAAKDYDFSAGAMRAHWLAGLADTRRTLGRAEWMRMPQPGQGIVVHDVHRQE